MALALVAMPVLNRRAIDVLIRANDPETIKHLIAVLKDENEYARRAAVEVLNEIGDDLVASKSVRPYLRGPRFPWC